MQQQDFHRLEFFSLFLKRQIKLDIYGSQSSTANCADLLLINDGQDLLTMSFSSMLRDYPGYFPLVCVGIHAGDERKLEYGVAGFPDYMGRGRKADLYATFVLEELFSFLHTCMPNVTFRKKFLAGFSLGGLMAFDMMIDHPQFFSSVGVFSGSFWWRSKALDDGYVEEIHRIMHAKIRTKQKHKELRFFLQTGQLDEKADRNKNGIIDSIDDTLAIINELEKIGYSQAHHITYVEVPDGKHDVSTWARVMPEFLKWLSLQQ